MFSAPTVVGDLVIVGSCNGMLRALDDVGGSVVWEYNIAQDGDQNNFHGNAIVLGDVLYIGTDGAEIGHVYAFDWATGEVRWKFPDPQGGVADIALFRDRLFAGTFRDILLCLDAASGAPLWTYPTGYSGGRDGFPGGPAVHAAAVYFGGLDGILRSMDPFSGDVNWETILGGRIRTSTVVVGESAYAGTSENMLFRVDCATGDIQTSFLTPGLPSQRIVSDGRHIALFLDWAENTGSIAAFDRELKKLLWQQSPAEGDKWTSAHPYLVDGDVVVGSRRGEIHAFDMASGAESWSLKVEGTVRGIGFTDSTMIVGTLEGKVYNMKRQR